MSDVGSFASEQAKQDALRTHRHKTALAAFDFAVACAAVIQVVNKEDLVYPQKAISSAFRLLDQLLFEISAQGQKND